jgi:hypothetical protein
MTLPILTPIGQTEISGEEIILRLSEVNIAGRQIASGWNQAAKTIKKIQKCC